MPAAWPFLIASLCLLVGIPSAHAHPGRLNADGCHNNTQLGVYECHGNAAPTVEVRPTFSGTVINVYDGDTLTILNADNQQIKIRLYGIDAPEKAQAHGKAAQQFAKELAHGSTVTIIEHDTDRYGRTVGDVVLEDGMNLNKELVRTGNAWWYYQYSNDRELGQLELDAKLAHIGLWKAKNPVPPWVYRKVKDLVR